MAKRAYTSQLRSESSGRTRERIVAAAALIISGQAPKREFSLEAAARIAGVTRLTVYRHFGSRRALLEAVFDDRALGGGLDQIPALIAAGDPLAGLDRLAAIFCDLWSADAPSLRWLLGAAADDPELGQALAARSEMRRTELAALVDQIVPADRAPPQRSETIAALYALTSFPFFAELTSDGASKDAACAIIRRMIRVAVDDYRKACDAAAL